LLTFLFFISLLILLSGIIQTDGALVESKGVARKLVLTGVAGRFEEHIIPTKNSGITRILTFYGKGRIIMRQDLVAWIMVPVLWGQVCWAWQPAASMGPNDFMLAFTNIVGLRYPQVNSARQVGFHINGNVEMFFLGAGSLEHRSNPNIWNLYQSQAKSGIKSFYESLCSAHNWPTRQSCLHEFAPLLFKDEAKEQIT
jgi:hypothetical protein